MVYLMASIIIGILELSRRYYFEKMNIFISMVILSLLVSFMYAGIVFLTTTFSNHEVSDFIAMWMFMAIMIFIFVSFPVITIINLFLRVKKEKK